jgi:Ca2+-binding EF-hand superfamily protein
MKIVSAILCLVLGSALAAQDKELREVFDRYDRDRDGIVAAAEFPGSPAQFAALDADRDGKVTFAEFKVSPTARALLRARNRDAGAPRARTAPADLAARRLAHLGRWDQDADGRVTRAEWSGSELAFATLDIDGNGVLDARDRAAAPAVADPVDGLREILARFKTYLPEPAATIARLDRDKDGVLTQAELGKDPLAPLFAHADRNGDERLDEAEIARAVGLVNAAVRARDDGNARPRAFAVPFAAWDKNDDGRLDVNEWLEHKQLFPRIDADRDGAVVRAEIERWVRAIERDGFIERFDLNDDGKVTLEEFDGPRDAFRRADRSGDGVVSGRDR